MISHNRAARRRAAALEEDHVGTITLGLIVGNRGFFPDHLCDSGRRVMIDVLGAAGADVVALGPSDTKFGSVESLDDAAKCADLFKAHRDRIAGVVVALPNFGDERAISNVLRWADLKVPVLVQAFPDSAGKMTIADRRDSFCGKMSACNNLRQYGIPFTLTRSHTVDPTGAEFAEDLKDFMATCRVVAGLRNARFGALGARPAAFNTVRYSEKLLERSGISVETLDLSELFGRAGRIADGDAMLEAKIGQISAYVSTKGVPAEAVAKMARLGVVIDRWMADQRLVGTALQCWTAMEEFYGVVPCTLMSMMSNGLAPSACETDVAGLVGMYALRLASGTPAALVDWNNNYDDDPDKGVVFHCSNLPKDIFETGANTPVMSYQAIIAGTVGRDNTFGTVEGRVRKSPFTYCRVSTDDDRGVVAAYVGEGETTDDSLLTFGGYGVVKIPRFQALLRFICEHGFEHHTAMSLSRTAASINEAFGKYLGWDVYRHV